MQPERAWQNCMKDRLYPPRQALHQFISILGEAERVKLALRESHPGGKDEHAFEI
jgi:hypothetical protein